MTVKAKGKSKSEKITQVINRKAPGRNMPGARIQQIKENFMEIVVKNEEIEKMGRRN